MTPEMLAAFKPLAIVAIVAIILNVILAEFKKSKREKKRKKEMDYLADQIAKKSKKDDDWQ